MVRVALIGDYNPGVVAHQAIPEALLLTGAEGIWFHTSTIENPEIQFVGFDGLWCVPASPYANTVGALSAICYAREHGVPFLGTCGGFQHALIEYARNACAIADAEHAEIDPSASQLLITPLTCPLVEQTGEIDLLEGSLIHQAYGQDRIVEGYHCSFGLNPEFADQLFKKDLRATARDSAGEVRAIELTSHPFFVATLFQPERRALKGEAPPLVTSFVRAMKEPNRVDGPSCAS